MHGVAMACPRRSEVQGCQMTAQTVVASDSMRSSSRLKQRVRFIDKTRDYICSSLAD